jgi:hypothetical protein
VDPVPDPLLLRKSGGIEPSPLDLYPGTLSTRPQRRSHKFEALTAMTMKSNVFWDVCHVVQ